LRRVDGVLIVGRVGRNRRDVAERLHETRTGVGAPLPGVVANGFRAGRIGAYGYTYDYAAAGAAPPVSVVAASPNGAVSAEERVAMGRGEPRFGGGAPRQPTLTPGAAIVRGP
jgi:Mrp family chromosome partitioning ATPase